MTALLAPIADIDKLLLTQVAQGDEQAFRQLFQLYHHRLGLYIFQLTASRELAEEIVQDVFLKVWMNRTALSAIAHFDAWLFTIAKHQALNALRKTARERIRQCQWEKEQSLSPLEAEELEALTDSEAQTVLLQEAIEQLPQQQKKVLILSRYHRLTYNDIAGKMNISRETVKSYLRIAITSITRYVNNRSLIGLLLFLLKK